MGTYLFHWMSYRVSLPSTSKELDLLTNRDMRSTTFTGIVACVHECTEAKMRAGGAGRTTAPGRRVQCGTAHSFKFVAKNTYCRTTQEPAGNGVRFEFNGPEPPGFSIMYEPSGHP